MHKTWYGSIFRSAEHLSNRIGSIAFILLIIVFDIGYSKKSIAVTSFNTALSKYEIKKGKNFNGTAIRLQIEYPKSAHYIIEVEGPKSQYRIWKKEKKFGIWTKSKSFTTQKISSYQFISTDLSEDYIKRFSRYFTIDMNGKKISFVDQKEHDPQEIINAVDILFQTHKDSMYYVYQFDQDPLNKTIAKNIPIMPGALSGQYIVKVYLLNSQKKIINTNTMFFTVSKDELYDRMEAISYDYPIFYTIISILITFLIVFSANILFKRK